jgi:ABC-type Na+ efflux pump permease subunit
MNELKINKDSWHYWLAHNLGRYAPWSDSKDICTYLRHVLGGAILFLFVVLLMSLLSFMVVDGLVWVAACLVSWMFIDPGLGGAFLIIIATGGGICGLWTLAAFGAKKSVEPQFVKEAWRNFHDKTCIRIKFD